MMRQGTATAARSSYPERRTEPRLQIEAMSEVMVNGRTVVCKIVNISSGGALIESRAIPSLGSNVRLRIPGIGPTPATVARATSTYYAVMFITPIDVADLTR